ncbi:dTMP kinase [Psychrosphaera aquimarina]|uniref:Thymidylate kinase n=1 Tax=Psychrosphaera aquimarina TaxID=2044854 RepID=A0ABU3R517_9GAMM|nr:dTMP kinase [Psychrosphaera aquimarina]MDU0114775.1 dTMP kinase [Psychrosphaera aquimarina]
MSKFIVVEGLEGAGKTTAQELIKAILTKQNIEFVSTREPGGTPLAEKMRDIVKSETDEILTPEAELLLMYASRIQLIENVIKPALDSGKWVLGDRHDMSSLAYQGGGRQLDQNLIMPIRNAVLKGFEPDLTILMDLDPKIGLARAAARGSLDRIEREQIEFFERTRAVYLSLADQNPKVVVIDASKDIDNVQTQITDKLTAWLTINL